jgi:hypothetical protein
MQTRLLHIFDSAFSPQPQGLRSLASRQYKQKKKTIQHRERELLEMPQRRQSPAARRELARNSQYSKDPRNMEVTREPFA